MCMFMKICRFNLLIQFIFEHITIIPSINFKGFYRYFLSQLMNHIKPMIICFDELSSDNENLIIIERDMWVDTRMFRD